MHTFPTQPVSPRQTLDLLWTRIRQRGDLPGFSKVINAILGAMRGEDDREFNMTKTVLSDPALTQKVLRLANSPMYSVFGRGINTVSKAVIVLGTEAIGHLALGLKLLDGLSAASSDSTNARSEMERALLAAHIARQVASTANMRDTEEAVVCSMLHTLGRMMVTFYLADHWAQIQTRCAEADLDEDAAAREVLGLGLDEFSRLIAQHWGLPASLVDSLQHVVPKKVCEPLSHADWLATVSTMSSRCADVLHQGNAASAAGISEIAGDYAEMLGLDVSQVLSAVDSAQMTAQADEVHVRPAKTSEAMKKTPPEPGKPVNSAQILTDGVVDICSASHSMSVAQLMTMALETTYQGLGLSRAIIFLHNREEAKYLASMCIGDGVQELVPRLVFSDVYQPDVFHAALANGKMIFVENAHEQTFMDKLPHWWKESLLSARGFVVLPLIVNRQPAGFIYGDWDQSLPPTKIEPAEILLLNELRDLVAKAMEL